MAPAECTQKNSQFGDFHIVAAIGFIEQQQHSMAYASLCSEFRAHD